MSNYYCNAVSKQFTKLLFYYPGAGKPVVVNNEAPFMYFVLLAGIFFC